MKLLPFSSAAVPDELDGADLEQIGAVDDVEHLLHVLLDDQHGQPLGADLADEIEHLLHHERREPGRRLVHQQHLRLRHQRAADRAHLLLAARHGAGRLRAAVLQPRKEAVDLVELLGEARARRRDEGADAQILLDRQPRKQPAVLRHMGDAVLDDVDAPAGRRSPALRASSLPWLIGSMPEMTRISVVLPAPFGPMTPTASPRAISSDTPNSAWNDP